MGKYTKLGKCACAKTKIFGNCAWSKGKNQETLLAQRATIRKPRMCKETKLKTCTFAKGQNWETVHAQGDKIRKPRMCKETKL